MISQQERRRLVEAYRNEPVYAAGALLKCVVCLVLVVGLWLMGGSVEPVDPSRLQAQAPAGAKTVDARPVLREKACASGC